MTEHTTAPAIDYHEGCRDLFAKAAARRADLDTATNRAAGTRNRGDLIAAPHDVLDDWDDTAPHTVLHWEDIAIDPDSAAEADLIGLLSSADRRARVQALTGPAARFDAYTVTLVEA